MIVLCVCAQAGFYAYAAQQDTGDQIEDGTVLRQESIFAPSGVARTGNPDEHLGPGMERVTIGGVSISAPKGMRVSKEGSRIKFEDTGEYMARRFDDLENRIAQLQARDAELRSMIMQLQAEVFSADKDASRGRGEPE